MVKKRGAVCLIGSFDTKSEDLQFLLEELKDMGFDGVQNFPTVGLMDGQFRKNLEETGISFQLEIDMIALAREMDMLTCPYVFTPGEYRTPRGGAGNRRQDPGV
jgi:predicted TIM-barrel enzyme